MNTLLDEDIFPLDFRVSSQSDGTVKRGKDVLKLICYTMDKPFSFFVKKIESLIGKAMGLQCKQRKNGPIYFEGPFNNETWEEDAESYRAKHYFVVKAISIYFKEISTLDKYNILIMKFRNHEDIEKLVHFLENFKEINSNMILADKFDLI